MGARLEMITRLILTATLGLLTACGPMTSGSLGADFARERVNKLLGRTPAAKPAAPAPDIATAAPGEILLVTIISRNAVAPLTKLAETGSTVTWVSPGQVSVTLQDGILIATRGLNEDLMGSEATGTRAALTAGGGTLQRTQSFLDSEDQIVLREVNCTVSLVGPETIAATTGSREAVKYTEACESPQFSFTNTYWLDEAGGDIVQSRQAVAPTVGFLKINPL